MKAVHSFKIAALAVFLAATFAAPDADAQRNRGAPAELYPDATRKSPTGGYAPRLARQHKTLQEIYTEEGREQEALALAEEIINHERAKPYDKAIAMMTAATVALSLDDEPRAIKYYEGALAEDALVNDNHYNVMINLAGLYINSDQFDKGEALLARVISETSTKNPDVYAMRASGHYNNKKYAEAIEALKKAAELKGESTDQWNQLLLDSYGALGQTAEAIALGEALLAKDPDDEGAIAGLAQQYMDSDQTEKAIALLDGARKRGLLNKPDDYQRLFSMYYNSEREAQAAAILEEGLANGAVPQEAQYYNMIAQAHYFGDNIPQAIAAGQKALELSKDGEPGIFLAQVLSQEDRSAEALAAAKAALAKGVKKPGDAWMVIGRSEFYLENLAGAKAAYREAAKDPATRDQANKALAQISR